MNARRLAALAAVSVLAAGCGAKSDADQAKSVAQDYIAALHEKDDAAACELQTASSKDGDGCTLHTHKQIVPNPPRFEDPIVTGERARVLVTGSNGSVTLELVKEDGGWKVEDYQGQLPK
jgi:hypothetical protein